MKAMRMLAALMVATLTFGFLVPTAQASETREYAVKAAYLFKFINLIEWPNESKIDNFVIGVVGPGPFGPSLDDIEGKLVRGKALQLVTYPMVKLPAQVRRSITVWFWKKTRDRVPKGISNDDSASPTHANSVSSRPSRKYRTDRCSGAFGL